MMKKIKAILILIVFLTNLTANAQKVSITTERNASDRELFAAEYLQKKHQMWDFSTLICFLS